MTQAQLLRRLRDVLAAPLPIPGRGQTALRHKRLMEVGCEDLSLARLAEAHWDALAILAEAGLDPKPDVLYGVWASEKPGQALRLNSRCGRLVVNGSKMFCSGAGLIDRALVTVGIPEQRLVDIDLRTSANAIQFDHADWKTNAFVQTQTATAIFNDVAVSDDGLVGCSGWYLERPGFWHGACGPAACWAGGAGRLVDFALSQTRSDPHRLAHLAAMHAAVWALSGYLDSAGREIDEMPHDVLRARIRARTLRHLVEQASSEILRRLLRAYGPYPLVMNEDIARHYQELDLYLRQSHAERDLEALGYDVADLRKETRAFEAVADQICVAT